MISKIVLFIHSIHSNITILLFKGGLSKFAKLARSVTRSRTALASQLPNKTDQPKQSNLTQVYLNCAYLENVMNYIIIEYRYVN